MSKKTIDEIRIFTDRTESSNIPIWLPSDGGSFDDTFTLNGKNLDGTQSKGEINILTDFNESSNSKKLEDINRYYTALYCLQQFPYYFDQVNQVLDYNTDGLLFRQSLETYLKTQQTGQGSAPYSKSLTSDIVRTYRKSTLKNSESDLPSILEFARTNTDFITNVVGVLGKVTYDSIIKQTLYLLLLQNGIVDKTFQKQSGQIWSTEAAKLQSEEFGFFIDNSGGTYSRAFPVVCCFVKSKSGKKKAEFLDASNALLTSKFFRTVTEDQLVDIIDAGGEKNFIELPNRDSGDSLYCIMYDFAKIIVLKPNEKEDYTLDLLKLGISYLSRKQTRAMTIKEFTSFYQSIKKLVDTSFDESIEESEFSFKYKDKHTQECSYYMNKDEISVKTKLNGTFRAELLVLLATLEETNNQILNIFNQQTKGDSQNFQFVKYSKDLDYKIILHFDNFYNLLAATTVNEQPQENTITYEQNVPFILEDYAYTPGETDLLAKFFSNKENLPTLGDPDKPDYAFTREFAMGHDIVFITDTFLMQLYLNLDGTKNSFKYETNSNQNKDSVKIADSVNLLELIKNRTSYPIDKKDYFILSAGQIYLKNDIVKRLSLKDFSFLFQSAKEDHIKFQTINHFLFLNEQELKVRSLTLDDFRDRIYYPILVESVSSTMPEISGDKTKDGTPNVIAGNNNKKENGSNDLLINNIITSELHCYEDIANSFDKAINADSPKDKAYYASQALVNIGLPILLALATQAIADKLSKLKSIHPDTADCLAQDEDNLKKNIIGYLDLAGNIDDPRKMLAYLAQGNIEIPKIPAIPFLLTFDVEKELKRRLIKYIIDMALQYLKEQLGSIITSMVDMCNADSYLTGFLSSAFPDANNSGDKKGNPTASGLPAGSSPTTYLPAIIADINTLIDQSAIESRQNVYQFFREKYGRPDYDYSDSDISNFFDYISSSVDAGEMAMLLKNSSSPEIRSTVGSYIRNYTNDVFYKSINDISSVAEFFVFLSNYIDYTLCYGTISNSLTNYSANVCDTDPQLQEAVLRFGEVPVYDQIADLSKALDELCGFKNPPTFDLFGGGPTLLTKRLSSVLNNAFYTSADSLNISSLIQNKETMQFPDAVYFEISNKSLFDEIPKEDTIDSLFYKYSIEFSFLHDVGTKNPITDYQKKTQIFKYLLNLNKNEQFIEEYKLNFETNLKSIGNSGLKTEQKLFDGYSQKYSDLQTIKIYG